jgi:cysteine desulfurase / selenocysteine lyase
MKEDFPILKNTSVIYLDNSATSQKPKQVIESITNYYENYNSNVHRGIHNLSQKATLAYEEAHEKVGKFINADSDEIIFTKGTTHSINILAQSLKQELQEGDEIVLSIMEHHSNIVPWQQIAKEKGAIVKFIPVVPGEFTLDLEKAKELISSKTKIVSIVHVSNTLGTINPINKIRQLAKDAYLVVDSAQSVPHMKVDVRDLDCDFLAFSGHKMLAPTGIGVLYGKRKHLLKISPGEFGGGMISEVHINKSTWADIPEKFEAGTPNISGAIALAKAIEYLENIGMEKVHSICMKLTNYALEELSKIEGIDIFGPNTNRGPVISFILKGVHPHDVSEILNRDNIAVRAGNHCTMPLHDWYMVDGTTRASFYLYNTKEDVDALIKGIHKVKEIFK